MPPRALYTPRTLFTLGGSSATVLVLAGLVRSKLGWDPWFVALILSEVLAFVGLTSLRLPAEVWSRSRTMYITVAACNGLLIYSQATGMNSIQTSVPSMAPRASEMALIPWIDPVPWFPPANQARAAYNAAVAMDSSVSTTGTVVSTL